MYAFLILMAVSTNTVILFEDIGGAWAYSLDISYKYNMHISRDLYLLHSKNIGISKRSGRVRQQETTDLGPDHLLFWDADE